MRVLAHPRLQPERLPIDDEPAIPVVVNSLGILLGRIRPGLYHFEDKKIVFVDQTPISNLAFQIGKAFGNKWRLDAPGGYGA